MQPLYPGLGDEGTLLAQSFNLKQTSSRVPRNIRAVADKKKLSVIIAWDIHFLFVQVTVPILELVQVAVRVYLYNKIWLFVSLVAMESTSFTLLSKEERCLAYPHAYIKIHN